MSYRTSRRSRYEYECRTELPEVLCRAIPGVNTPGSVFTYPTEHNLGIIHRSAVTAMQQPSTSRSIFCVFGSFAASLSRHLAYRAVVANMGLRLQLILLLKRHSRGTLSCDQRAVKPGARLLPRLPLIGVHDLSPLSVFFFPIICNSLKATTDCLGNMGPVRTCHPCKFDLTLHFKSNFHPRGCAFIRVLPPPATSVSSVGHSYPYPELR